MTTHGVSGIVRIGTRGSALARAQAALVAQAVAAEGRPHRIVVIETDGDRRAPDTAWGEGAFVAAIEQALLDERVDVAVHSAKDVPTDEDARLRIVAYLPRADPRDALVVRGGGDGIESLADLPPGAIVGTDSPRRAAFVRAYRPDLVVRPLHGNVDTRLRRLDSGEADALVLAVAGLVRLGREDRISAILDADVVPPAPGQGAIAVQIRATDARLLALGASIDDERTRAAVEAERAFLRASGGGCRSPIGALATIADGRIRVTAGHGIEDGAATAVETAEAPVADASRLAGDLALRLAARLAEMATNARRPAVIVTRPAPAGGPLGGALAARGIAMLPVPAIAIEPLPASDGLDAAIASLPSADRVVVTSANGARAVAGHLGRLGIDASDVRWAAVGGATAAALTDAGARDPWLPSKADAATLALELPLAPGDTIAVVRGRLAEERVANALRARGADVREIVVYDTREAPAASRPLLESALRHAPVAVVLASPSAARGLLTLAAPGDRAVAALPAVCIGPRTADAARGLGYDVAGVAEAPDPASVAEVVAAVVGRLVGVRHEPVPA